MDKSPASAKEYAASVCGFSCSIYATTYYGADIPSAKFVMLEDSKHEGDDAKTYATRCQCGVSMKSVPDVLH